MSADAGLDGTLYVGPSNTSCAKLMPVFLYSIGKRVVLLLLYIPPLNHLSCCCRVVGSQRASAVGRLSSLQQTRDWCHDFRQNMHTSELSRTRLARRQPPSCPRWVMTLQQCGVFIVVDRMHFIKLTVEPAPGVPAV